MVSCLKQLTFLFMMTGWVEFDREEASWKLQDPLRW